MAALAQSTETGDEGSSETRSSAKNVDSMPPNGKLERSMEGHGYEFPPVLERQTASLQYSHTQRTERQSAIPPASTLEALSSMASSGWTAEMWTARHVCGEH